MTDIKKKKTVVWGEPFEGGSDMVRVNTFKPGRAVVKGAYLFTSDLETGALEWQKNERIALESS